MSVANTRVGQVTDFDKLTLDVYTNGTLAPAEAVSLAAKVLSEHLSLFIDLSENAKTAEVMVEKEDDEKEKVLEMSIDELEMCIRDSSKAGHDKNTLYLIIKEEQDMLYLSDGCSRDLLHPKKKNRKHVQDVYKRQVLPRATKRSLR